MKQKRQSSAKPVPQRPYCLQRPFFMAIAIVVGMSCGLSKGQKDEIRTRCNEAKAALTSLKVDSSHFIKLGFTEQSYPFPLKGLQARIDINDVAAMQKRVAAGEASRALIAATDHQLGGILSVHRGSFVRVLEIVIGEKLPEHGERAAVVNKLSGRKQWQAILRDELDMVYKSDMAGGVVVESVAQAVNTVNKTVDAALGFYDRVLVVSDR